MIDFDEARAAAFKLIENTRTVEQVNEKVRNRTGGTNTKTFWRVIVEVPVGDRIKDFTLEVSLKPDFPLSLPEVKLAEKDYEQTKYLPHIDSHRGICLFDQEKIKQNTLDPAGIVNECVNQAVRILEDGLNKDRTPEFNDEIIAYWENTYHSNDSVSPAYLGSNMSSLEPGRVTAYLLQPAHANVNFYVGNEDTESDQLLEFFKLRGHTLESLDAFYLGEINQLNPPFYFTNKSLLEFIQHYFGEVWKEVKGYLNRSLPVNKFMLFSVVSGTQPIFMGFYARPLKTNLKGWRSGRHHSMVEIMDRINPAQPVIRIRFNEFNPARLQIRTDGANPVQPYKRFMFAGLGSIGSNLLGYLNALDVEKYVLVDPEVLVLENVNRHLLSFSDVGQNKVDGIAKYLKFHNPFVAITKHASSIVDVIQRQLAEVNEMDIIFCAIGKDAIEVYILQQLTAGLIQKPVIFFWVEPYLLGAHMLFITPNTNFSLSDLEDNGFYKFNIIAPETYKDPAKKTFLREAGCQGSYMPYGKAEIVRFFSALVPHLFDLIQTPPTENKVITYVGELNTAAKLCLPISAFASPLHSHQVLIQTI
jgi:hypothetical protein